jgi:hypothetical protein
VLALFKRSACFLVVAISAAFSTAGADTYAGGKSACRTWLDLRQSGRADIEFNWIHGYMMALADHETYLAPHANEVTEQAVFGWIDGYCKQNPDQNLRAAIRALDADLRHRFVPPPDKKFPLDKKWSEAKRPATDSDLCRKRS